MTASDEPAGPPARARSKERVAVVLLGPDGGYRQHFVLPAPPYSVAFARALSAAQRDEIVAMVRAALAPDCRELTGVVIAFREPFSVAAVMRTIRPPGRRGRPMSAAAGRYH